MPRVFISYKRADKDKVFPLKEKIEAAIGEPCWIDLDGIESDAQFVNVIMQAIDDAEIFLFMYSKEHSCITDFEKDWTVHEINYAQDQGKRIVFINIDRTPLAKWFKFMFGLKQQVDATSESAVEALLVDLRNWLNIKDEPQVIIRTAADNDFQDTGSKKDGLTGKQKAMIISIAILIASLILIPLISTKFLSQKSNLGTSSITTTSVMSDVNPEIDYQKAEEFFIAKDYSTAVKYYQKAADSNYAKAQNNLGCMYRWGLGVEKSAENALKWYRKAADQGDSYGQNNLAYMLANGIGTQKDVNLARVYYQKSSDQKNPYALAHLGVFYRKGLGRLDKDNEAALICFKLSSQQNNTYGYTELGNMYEAGLGVTQSTKSAITLWSEAARHGNAEACKLLMHHIYTLDDEPLSKMAKRYENVTEMQHTPKYDNFDYTLF